MSFRSLAIPFSFAALLWVGVSAASAASCEEEAKSFYKEEFKSAQCIPFTTPCTAADQVSHSGDCPEGTWCCVTKVTADPCQVAAKKVLGEKGDGTCQTKEDCTKNGGQEVAAANACGSHLGVTYICCAIKPTVTGYSGGSSTKLKDPLGGVGLVGALNRVINTFLGVVGAIALLVFVFAGVTYMTAGGSEERVTRARDTMKYAIIGLALITFAYALTSFYFQALTTTPTVTTTPTPTP
jgi:hypothetical protein